MKLYHYWRSSSSWRVRWALELKCLKPKYIHINLLDEENEKANHIARHPLGYVPVLEIDGKYLIESVAILEWLEESYPEPKLYPGHPFEKAQIRALVELINADTQPIQNLNVVEYYTEDPLKRKTWNQYFIRRGLQAYQVLATKTAQTFSIGNDLTAADLFLIPQCYNALRNEIDLNEFPLLKKIYEAALKISSCDASSPEKYKPR